MDIDINFDSDGEELTAAELMSMMEEMWLNEKFAPELLPNKMDIVDCMYLQIQTMEKNISTLEKHDFIRRAHEMELIRIRYMLTSYLRTRLVKIEKFAQTILEQEEARERAGQEPYLTENEKTFATAYRNSFDSYVKDVLKFIPGFVPDDHKEHPVKPPVNNFVFLQSKKSIEGVIVDEMDDDIVDIRDGSKMIMPYSSVVNLLKNGDVKLI